MPAIAAHARHPRAPPFVEPPGYARHRPEKTLPYQLVEQHYPTFREMRSMAGRSRPGCIEQEFDAYLKCGRLEEGFLRVRCEHCHAERPVAFSCKKRGLCPSCGARRMAETAALLADEGLPERPLRQWVLSLPSALRFLLPTDPAGLRRSITCQYRALTWGARRQGPQRQRLATGVGAHGNAARDAAGPGVAKRGPCSRVGRVLVPSWMVLPARVRRPGDGVGRRQALHPSSG
jgi:ribosomal protein S27E